MTKDVLIRIGLIWLGFVAVVNGQERSAPERLVSQAGCLAESASETTTTAAPTEQDRAAAERGFQFLTTKAYLPPDFDQEVFDELWKVWEEPDRTAALQADAVQRRRLAFARYGLTEVPGRESGVALQYVETARGWSMNCLACHSGKVGGNAILGVPNSLYALQTLTEDVRMTKLQLGKKFAHMDKGSLLYPLGGSIGTTNAVMFGKILMSYRDADLNVHLRGIPMGLDHHDHDAPAWWHFKKKTRIYSDAFVPKNHRALMQFLLIPSNGPEHFQKWESDYRDIQAWIESLEPPRYPWPIDNQLADAGENVFNRNCSECHGTYGANASYPERVISIDEIGTDPVRLKALDHDARKAYADSWFAREDEIDVILEPKGYVAPPLDGVWASAPYFHNGSVPTLWHVLYPDSRPKVWKRTADGYDQKRVGLEVAEYEQIPNPNADPRHLRTYFDSHLPGKSAGGHRFPDALTDQEKREVLEYLKSL